MYKQTGVKPGSPPHTRGKVRHLSHIPQLVGITPAHAGKSPWTAPKRQRNGDHPRTRGEKHFLGVSQCHNQGSPPHTRGKAVKSDIPVSLVGITPAHAGKSNFFAAPCLCGGDHPRTRGEKSLSASQRIRKPGSPPHTRGKVPVRQPHPGTGWDHPRTRGEKKSSVSLSNSAKGSPPHTRGKALFSDGVV